ncbi:MAG: FtsX-like permease family protein [Blautia sp.]|uniref:FtsX-like permease family protein n=1 Tax=Blautia sp. TaxID=1955243 RepID=UPI002E79B250|nr:FtsX-like permease family protein [Blautia sp.]MEE1444570.1 FtsX-like permease family protein [Blautia sp.]
MFYSLIKRNSRANRKENSIYFVSMIIAIIAFYVILSLENMDVIRFIKDMESDAVHKLLSLVPALYVFSLCVIFFLVFFTTRYQMERRNHELGMYLMMGMKRSRLFFMLIAEDLVNTLLSLLIGIPMAVLFSEITSLAVARVVGIGILGHKFTISMTGILWTVGGLLLVKLVTLVSLSGKTVQKEPQDLMKNSTVGREKQQRKTVSFSCLIAGIMLLIAAYGVGIFARDFTLMSLNLLLGLLICGTTGTFLFFQGLYPLFNLMMKKQKGKPGLGSFTLRQLQESVFLKNGSLAAISLLALISFCCMAFGISSALTEKPVHHMDYTFHGEEEKVKKTLEKSGVMEKFQVFYPMHTSNLDTDLMVSGELEKGFYKLDYENILRALKAEKDSEGKENVLYDFEENGYLSVPHILCVSDYNAMLKAAGESEIPLRKNEMMLYANPEFSVGGKAEILKKILQEDLQIYLNGEPYTLRRELAEYDIVTDSAITLAYALVLPDDLFWEAASKSSVSTYWNGVLKESVVRKQGLIQAISEINQKLNQTEFGNQTDLVYESYVENIGRHLFYIIAESYTTLYLGVIFLVIANTALGTQYLMYQRKTGKRYQTITALGCSYEELSRSGRTQIRWYFLLPVLVACVSAVFGIFSFTEGLLSSYFEMQKNHIIFVGILVIFVICVVEYLYMMAVMRTSDRTIRELMKRKREED